jgi:hypothetical protein
MNFSTYVRCESELVRLTMAASHGQKLPLLYGTVRTANHHSGSHPLLLGHEKSSSNKNGIYWDMTAQDSAVDTQYHKSLTYNPQRHQMNLQGMGTRVGRHPNAHHTTPIQCSSIITIQTNTSGSASANLETKNWDPR